jgi:dTMP kinase
VIDLDPATALGRGNARGGAEDRFESLGLDFQKRLAEGFRALVREFPLRVRLIDGSGSAGDVAARIRAAL